MSDSLEQRLLALVLAPNYQPNKPRVLAKRLDLTTEERVDLRRLIKKLTKAGKLTYGKNHIIFPPAGGAAPAAPAAHPIRNQTPHSVDAKAKSNGAIVAVARGASSV